MQRGCCCRSTTEHDSAIGKLVWYVYGDITPQSRPAVRVGPSMSSAAAAAQFPPCISCCARCLLPCPRRRCWSTPRRTRWPVLWTPTCSSGTLTCACLRGRWRRWWVRPPRRGSPCRGWPCMPCWSSLRLILPMARRCGCSMRCPTPTSTLIWRLASEQQPKQHRCITLPWRVLPL